MGGLHVLDRRGGPWDLPRGRVELRAWIEKVSNPGRASAFEADEIAETSDGRVFARLSLTGRGKA